MYVRGFNDLEETIQRAFVDISLPALVAALKGNFFKVVKGALPADAKLAGWREDLTHRDPTISLAIDSENYPSLHRLAAIPTSHVPELESYSCLCGESYDLNVVGNIAFCWKCVNEPVLFLTHESERYRALGQVMQKMMPVRPPVIHVDSLPSSFQMNPPNVLSGKSYIMPGVIYAGKNI